MNVSVYCCWRTAVETSKLILNTDIDPLGVIYHLFRNPFLKTREEMFSWLKHFAKSA